MMIDDIEGGGQESTGDTGGAPPSEPAPDSSAELTSEIRRSIDTQRERGPDGKFVKGSGEPRGAEPRAAPAKGVATGASSPKQVSGSVGQRVDAVPGGPGAAPIEHPVGTRPPPGFSVATVKDWDTLPEHVKADIAKREQEINGSMRRYGGLKAFAEEAESNGTTLQNAVNDYVAVETELKKDPVHGVEYLFKRMGLNPLVVLKSWLSRYVPQSGTSSVTTGTQPQQPQTDPNAIANHAIHAVRSEFQQREIHSDIAKFSADPANRFFPNVRQDMALLVQAGKAADLRQAYDAACWLHPEIRAILLEEAKGGQGGQRTSVRAQNAAKAVTGAPSGNSHAGDAPRRRDLSLDDEIRESIRRQRGAA